MIIFESGNDLDGYSCDRDEKEIYFSFWFNDDWKIIEENYKELPQLIGQEPVKIIRINRSFGKVHLDIDWDEKLLFIRISLESFDDDALAKQLAEKIKNFLLSTPPELSGDERNELFDDFYHGQK